MKEGCSLSDAEPVMSDPDDLMCRIDLGKLVKLRK